MQCQKHAHPFGMTKATAVLEKRIIEQIATLWPNFKEQCIATEVLTPRDLRDGINYRTVTYFIRSGHSTSFGLFALPAH